MATDVCVHTALKVLRTYLGALVSDLIVGNHVDPLHAYHREHRTDFAVHLVRALTAF